MKRFVQYLLIFCAINFLHAQPKNVNTENLNVNLDTIYFPSRLAGLSLAMLYSPAADPLDDYPVLMLHGSSFPSSLAFAFRMGGFSWMDHISQAGLDVYALDFLGYGNADRYPEMKTSRFSGNPPGRAADVVLDVERAVREIIQRTKKTKVYLIAHSWGGTVATLYAEHYPEHVEKLILFAAISPRDQSSPIVEVKSDIDMLAPEERVRQMKELAPAVGNHLLAEEIINEWGEQWLASDPLAQASGQRLVRFPSGPSLDVQDMLHGRSYIHPESIKAPVLLIRGEWDQYPSNDDYGLLFNQLTSARRKKYVVVEKGTHVMHLEQSRHQLFNEVLRFIKESQTTTYREQTGTIAVIFEVIPNNGYTSEYLEIAKSLRQSLEKSEGFISIERFESLSDPGKILSLSFWRDEASVQNWRNLEMHRIAQKKGRAYIFKNYRLRVVRTIRDYSMKDRNEAPTDSKTFHRD